MGEKSVKILREYELFKRREELQPHMSYAHEKERHRVITEGRVDLLEEVLGIPADGTWGTLASNELRNRKNMYISAITLFTRAAMDGGLSEEVAYAMSDGYIQSGELCTKVSEIEGLYNRAFSEFTHAVANKGTRHFGSAVEKVIEYIQIHLHEQITLTEAAEQAGISSCYLSRNFKQETGKSFVEYIQKERVEAARHMLIYSNYTLTEISEYLHFSSQSYFSKIFQKHVGMTPGKYARLYREKENW